MTTLRILNQTFPAIQGRVGHRLATFSTQLSLDEVEAFLGHDPRSKNWKRLPPDLEQLYRHLQRATQPQRLQGIKQYIRSRLGAHSVAVGAFPAISIGVQQHIHTKETDPEVPGSVLASIDLSNRSHRVLIDGLARIGGALELRDLRHDKSLTPEEQRELADIMENLTFPVTVFAPAPGTPPLSDDELGQLFADFNFRVTPVPDHIAIALDQSDLYIRATERLAKLSQALGEHGGMLKRTASLGKHATGIVPQQTLLRFVRGACEGESFQESNRAEALDGNLTGQKFEQTVERMAEFVDAFADEMGEAFADRTCLHLSSPGWQALGVIFHDVVYRMNGTDPIKVARALGRLDWKRSGELWKGIVTVKTKFDGMTELVMRGAGSSAKRQIVQVLRRQLGIDKLLEQAKAA